MDRLMNIIQDDAKRICSQVDLGEINGKSILITGASGLIGVYLLACLKYLSSYKSLRFKVVAVMKNKPTSYMNKFLDYDGVTLLCGDLTDYDFCKELPYADYIIHAAGYAQPVRFMEDRVKTLQLNTLTAFWLFNKLSVKGKFLFFSSSEVYSGLPNPPYKESDIGITNTDHPRSCYIEAKRCGEAICYAYRARGIDAKSARLSLVYGPGTRPGDQRVINVFIYKALKGQINLLDQGEDKRTYCYISDAVEVLWNILLRGKEPLYNVGGASKITISDLARKIGGYLNVPVVFPKETTQKIIGAPDAVSLDTTKVKKEFKKTEYVSLDEGLKNTIEWQKALYEAVL